jgi:hypothetical protein
MFSVASVLIYDSRSDIFGDYRKSRDNENNEIEFELLVTIQVAGGSELLFHASLKN